MTALGDDTELEISVVEVRGKKRVGFDGLEHLQLDEEVKEDLLQRYEEIILALDDLADEYEDGPDRAWHIGRILDECDVTENSDITVADIARYNTIRENKRRMTYCREVHRFFPDQGYDSSHNVTALGELASRSKGQEREAEARRGYQRLVEAGEDLTRRDIFEWWELNEADPSLDDVVAEVVDHYNEPSNIVASIRRVLLLHDQSPEEFTADEIRSTVKRHLEDQEESINE